MCPGLMWVRAIGAYSSTASGQTRSNLTTKHVKLAKWWRLDTEIGITPNLFTDARLCKKREA